MWQMIHALAIASLLGSAVYVYSLKYETIYRQEQVAKLKKALQHEREAIQWLRAEWNHLIRPNRLQRLAEQHLKETEILNLRQIIQVGDLPPKRIEKIASSDSDIISEKDVHQLERLIQTERSLKMAE